MKLYQGQRVIVHGCPGRVAYVRMAPPSYAEIAAVSVVLDEHRGRPGYAGTIFDVSAVGMYEEDGEWRLNMEGAWNPHAGRQ